MRRPAVFPSGRHAFRPAVHRDLGSQLQPGGVAVQLRQAHATERQLDAVIVPLRPRQTADVGQRRQGIPAQRRQRRAAVVNERPNSAICICKTAQSGTSLQPCPRARLRLASQAVSRCRVLNLRLARNSSRHRRRCSRARPASRVAAATAAQTRPARVRYRRRSACPLLRRNRRAVPFAQQLRQGQRHRAAARRRQQPPVGQRISQRGVDLRPIPPRTA
ncbi:Uncharacterised protein [Chromobacterium violaceum]|uniref:Uncharacterized protein n=1 Tax=Chromobacterium violaceum TaxID=536 RepID=A0A3S4HM67_CHRVL|nr:Uncharacterised protein [Chromobacterium violaceum]